MFLYLEIFIAGKPCSEQQYLWVKESSTSHLKGSVWQRSSGAMSGPLAKQLQALDENV